MRVTGEACPMWVPLIENKESEGDGADYFVKKDIDQLLHHDGAIDTVILGCTHYPLLYNLIDRLTECKLNLIDAGREAAMAAKGFLKEKDMLSESGEKGRVCFFVTDKVEGFSRLGKEFLGEEMESVTRLDIENLNKEYTR